MTIHIDHMCSMINLVQSTHTRELAGQSSRYTSMLAQSIPRVDLTMCCSFIIWIYSQLAPFSLAPQEGNTINCSHQNWKEKFPSYFLPFGNPRHGEHLHWFAHWKLIRLRKRENSRSLAKPSTLSGSRTRNKRSPILWTNEYLVARTRVSFQTCAKEEQRKVCLPIKRETNQTKFGLTSKTIHSSSKRLERA